jgi:hypothetical protein
MGRPDEAESSLLNAADRAERGGINPLVALLRAEAVSSALAQRNLEEADVRWAKLLPEEEQRLAAHERGIEVVRLLLLGARLSIEHHRPDEALRSLERAATLIASRGQPTNPDARALEALETRALLEERRYAEAALHAQRAIAIAEQSAIDAHSSAWVGEALILRAHAEVPTSRGTAAATARQALPHLTSNLDPASPLIAEARALSNGDGAPGPRQ